MRRLWAGAEARESGIALVARATGLSRTTVRDGIYELAAGAPTEGLVRVRRAGAGRPPLEVVNPALPKALEALVEPLTRGDPMSPLRWTTKSTRVLAAELTRQGHPCSPQKVGELLHGLGYSLQGLRKAAEGESHPDRNAQFEHINARVEDHQQRGQPVISVDTKKKELVGNFKNGGREWQRKGEPTRVNVYDFITDAVGKVIPYGVYDLANNTGWVNVGIDHDTPEFAVESIRRWWRSMGKKGYPDATELLITADGGGSNAWRSRVFKVELQRLADETGLEIGISHFPPGTSKWNKIEHRLFCHITQNWRGRPLTDYETIVQLIGATRTAAGLKVKARLDKRKYPKGRTASDDDLADLNLTRDDFHGEWNYTISPRNAE